MENVEFYQRMISELEQLPEDRTVCSMFRRVVFDEGKVSVCDIQEDGRMGEWREYEAPNLESMGVPIIPLTFDAYCIGGSAFMKLAGRDVSSFLVGKQMYKSIVTTSKGAMVLENEPDRTKEYDEVNARSLRWKDYEFMFGLEPSLDILAEEYASTYRQITGDNRYHPDKRDATIEILDGSWRDNIRVEDMFLDGKPCRYLWTPYQGIQYYKSLIAKEENAKKAAERAKKKAAERAKKRAAERAKEEAEGITVEKKNADTTISDADKAKKYASIIWKILKSPLFWFFVAVCLLRQCIF